MKYKQNNGPSSGLHLTLDLQHVMCPFQILMLRFQQPTPRLQNHKPTQGSPSDPQAHLPASSSNPNTRASEVDLKGRNRSSSTDDEQPRGRKRASTSSSQGSSSAPTPDTIERAAPRRELIPRRSQQDHMELMGRKFTSLSMFSIFSVLQTRPRLGSSIARRTGLFGACTKTPISPGSERPFSHPSTFYSECETPPVHPACSRDGQCGHWPPTNGGRAV